MEGSDGGIMLMMMEVMWLRMIEIVVHVPDVADSAAAVVAADYQRTKYGNEVCWRGPPPLMKISTKKWRTPNCHNNWRMTKMMTIQM
jgi:hypothetical protein